MKSKKCKHEWLKFEEKDSFWFFILYASHTVTYYKCAKCGAVLR